MARALQWEPNVCIASGVAGSLRATYRDRRGVCGSRSDGDWKADGRLRWTVNSWSAAERRGVRLAERLLVVANMVVTAEDKGRLGRMAEAVEMESFAVLTEAAGRKIPGVAIRAISDAADQDLPMDFNGVLDEQGSVSIQSGAFAGRCAPRKFPDLVASRAG